MSNDDSGNGEGQGIPGYSANNTIPGGFSLPLPTATNSIDPEPEAEQGADPWSSTWDDTSWQLPATDSSASLYSAEELSQYAGSDHAARSDWSDSYDHGGGPGEPTGVTTASGWEPWEPSGASAYNPDTGHWSELQHNAEIAAQSTEEYSGWAPAGSQPPATPSAAPLYGLHYAGDHRAAERAHAAAPPIDPDVAAAAAELGHEASPTAYGPTPVAHAGSDRPSADDLITVRSKGERQKVKASSGLRRAFGMGPGLKELLERDRIDRIARPLSGRKTIMVINTKGGGGKTLVTLMLASFLGRYRSGSVLAWDNNETEGTLGMRAPSQSHHRTVVDLLGTLPQIAADPNAGTSELEHWVREQRALSFDVLASADDDEAMRVIGEQEFEDLHTQLSRFYRMIVVDTGNNRLAPNWLAAAARADMLVFATSLKDDTSVVAAKNLDALVAMGRGDLVKNAVCVISHTTAKGNDVGAGVHTREHFEQWVRSVVDIPYDPALAPGLHLDPLKISRKTHDSCMEMAAVVVDGL
jgi:MinD-like ATPase involved in chromosome partitioning or flagellar assembly